MKWPEGREERRDLKKVNESMVDDLETITKVMPSIQKNNKNPNDTAAINQASTALKNDLAISIFERISGLKIAKAQDPNDTKK